QPVRIRMHPGATIQMRLVNEKGEPIAGAIACADAICPEEAEGHRFRVLDQRFRTDKEGRFTWTHGPEETVSWDFIGATNYRDKRNQRLKPQGKEIVVTLQPVFRAFGAVTDQETGKSIAAFRVTPGVCWDQEDRVAYMWNHHGTLNARDGQWLY